MSKLAVPAPIQRKPTRAVKIGSITIGANHPIAVQSMCATPTRQIEDTLAQIRNLESVNADIIRIAADNQRDAKALIEIRAQTEANLSVDLQENYRLAAVLAPHVEKLRYNPGHLYHHERSKPWQDKVKYLADIAQQYDCAMRVGVNAGSMDPSKIDQFPADDPIGPMVASALEHCELLDSIGFERYCVSLKNSDPRKAQEAYERFAAQRPEIPLHLGVTEAGMPPDGVSKTRMAFLPLLSQGIGDTLRVSLTLPHELKQQEIEVGRRIIADAQAGQSVEHNAFDLNTLNIISCPSCSRVENEAFIDLAHQVKIRTQYAKQHSLSIAVMGCRVNGPGETDDADLGLWCGPNFVNLSRRGKKLGAFPYDEVLDKMDVELKDLITQVAS
ncbi:MAG: flavodoxin/ferredoxin-dependent (E)-4-hydroxy-3-methylbut-2-enyl-diphosphate synthase [Arenicellales bacterium]